MTAPAALAARIGIRTRTSDLCRDRPMAAMTSRHDALLSETRRRLSRILTGGRYVNYADMLDTAEDWWGENTAELESIASHYDPGHTLVSRLHP